MGQCCETGSTEAQDIFSDIGLYVPQIMLPGKNVDLATWGTAAGGQQSSEPEYWQTIEKMVHDKPSTLHITYPGGSQFEDPNERIKHIQATQRQYLDNYLNGLQPGFILVERTIGQETRKGLVVGLDLERYDYNSKNKPLCTASEETHFQRLQTAIDLRKEAFLETPHIMVLIDDQENILMNPLFQYVQQKKIATLYDLELQPTGSRIRGWHLTDYKIIYEIAQKLKKIADKNQYGQNKSLLYAVGDGNHSLACAKIVWEKLKEENPDIVKQKNHPARYALVELINVHDPGLQFFPIHRVIFDADVEDFISDFQKQFEDNVLKFQIDNQQEMVKMSEQLVEQYPGCHLFPYITGDSYGIILVKKPSNNTEYKTLQDFLDEYEKKHEGKVKVDFIHGNQNLERIVRKQSGLGFYLPCLDKNSLFKTILADGSLPKKSFSIGNSLEKRFYFECRKLIP